ncbi:hypothetical protein HDU76_008725 [Blyttiomyces sp. JEL0837]|nr:hypothetical protein HDU76_008725 [Blyttiomyces sp. JEL0837]
MTCQQSCCEGQWLVNVKADNDQDRKAILRLQLPQSCKQPMLSTKVRSGLHCLKKIFPVIFLTPNPATPKLLAKNMIATLFIVLTLLQDVLCIGQSPFAMGRSVKDLFGGSAGWEIENWRTVDDRVRGGSSTSSLRLLNDGSSVVFSGNLDTSTLGGAGFASQLSIPSQPFDLSGYDGIVIHALKGDGKTYSLNVKNTAEKRRPDDRVEASIEYKYIFNATQDSFAALAPFTKFNPYYRGRPVSDAPPLDPSNVYAISIMMQSYFDQQKGPFELVIQSISAYSDTERSNSNSKARKDGNL